ncbi:MAG: hypothetical protein AABZ30_01405 [Myxococcota bacterium]
MTLTLRARVKAGRLVLDEPVDLPDGSEVDLVPADQDDDLEDEDRARLHAALERSVAEFASGKAIDARKALKRLPR